MAAPTAAPTAEPTVPPEPGSQSGPLGLTPRPALTRCLDIAVDAFGAEHWGQTPCRSRTAGFTDLFSGAAVDELVTRRGLRTPFLRMARQGTVLPSSRFTSSGGVGAQIGDQADGQKIAAEMAEGATLVLQGLHRMWPPIRSFADQLAADLGHPVQVNAYVTPPSSQGFAPHYDTHDVFVLQVEGTKSWTVHAPVVDHPLADQPWEQHADAVRRRATEPPFLTITMAPGDCLYLPRGWLHSAAADTEPSIHLTVGIHALSGRDVLDALVRATAGDALLRRNLPLGVGTDPGAHQQAVELVVTEALTRFGRIPVDDVLPHLARAFDRATRPEPIGPLAQLRGAEQADDLTVRLRLGLRARVLVTDDGVELRAGGRRIAAPAQCHRVVASLAAGETLTAQTAPGLDRADAAVLIRRLLAESIVVPVDR